MRHSNSGKKLGRTPSHRKALFRNMASAMITYGKIRTTEVKAKELRRVVEPLITLALRNDLHSRRLAIAYLNDKELVREIFEKVAQGMFQDRPGGYTRILKTGNRLGDNAQTCFIELVDYNEAMLKDKKDAKTKTTRRSRRKSAAAPVEQAEKAVEAAAETPELPAAEEAK